MMKRFKIYSLLIATVYLAPSGAWSQPTAVKQAAQSVFTLTTFNADGTIHSSTHGVFTGKDNEAIAMWHPFDGAQRAVVIDMQGRQHEVEAMLGVSELYDVCRFRVQGKALKSLPITTSDEAPASVYLVDYSPKKPTVTRLTPQRIEKFMTSNNYYVFNDVDISSTALGCPIVDDAGRLLGIMQRPENGGQAFSSDARLTTTFEINGLTLNDRTMRATGIRTALPNDEQQATLTLMIAAQQTDSAKVAAYIDEFIQKFPTSTEGYNTRANQYLRQGKLDLADATYGLEVKRAEKKDQAYMDYAKAVYHALLTGIDSTYTKWSLAKALELAQQAYSLNPLPVYKHLQAQILFSQEKYQEAYEQFMELQKTALGNYGEVFYEAAQCKIQLKAPLAETMALLDSAVNVQKGPASAPYVLARARAYDATGEYRKAFVDYLAYDSLINYRGTHDFYYTKYRCEMKLHQYQIALNDIAHAIVLNRTEPTYYAEMASLQLRINQPADAIRTCNMGLQVTQDYPDLYIIMGIAQCESKQKEAGLLSLQKAKELGDSRADGLISKYNK